METLKDLFSLLQEGEAERRLGMQFVAQLVGDGTINSTHCHEAVNKILGQLVDLERATPKLRSHVAHVAAWSVVEGKGKIMTLAELDEALRAQVGGGEGALDEWGKTTLGLKNVAATVLFD